MTNQSPILLEENGDYCYLRTGEFSCDSRVNVFQTGTITYDDHYDSINTSKDPLIMVSFTPTGIQPKHDLF